MKKVLNFSVVTLMLAGMLSAAVPAKSDVTTTAAVSGPSHGAPAPNCMPDDPNCVPSPW